MTWSFLWVFDYVIRLRNPLSSAESRTNRMHAFTWPFALVLDFMLYASGDIGCVRISLLHVLLCQLSRDCVSLRSRSDDGTCNVIRGSPVNLVRRDPRLLCAVGAQSSRYPPIMCVQIIVVPLACFTVVCVVTSIHVAGPKDHAALRVRPPCLSR